MNDNFSQESLRHLVLFPLLNNGPSRRSQPLCVRGHSFVGLRIDCCRELIHSSTEVSELYCKILTSRFIGNFEKPFLDINKFFRPLPDFVNTGIVHNDVSKTDDIKI